MSDRFLIPLGKRNLGKPRIREAEPDAGSNTVSMDVLFNDLVFASTKQHKITNILKILDYNPLKD